MNGLFYLNEMKQIGEIIMESAAKIFTPSDIHAIANKLNGLRSSLGKEGSDEADITQKDGKFRISKSFRNWSFFSSRSGVEDDDNPDFTGKDKVEKILSKYFSGVDIEVWDDEKGWFTVVLSGIYDSSSDSVPLDERPLSTVGGKDYSEHFIEQLKKQAAPNWDKIAKIVNAQGKDWNIDEYVSNGLDIKINIPVIYMDFDGHISYKGHVMSVSFDKDNYYVRIIDKSSSLIPEVTEVFYKKGKSKSLSTTKLIALVKRALSASASSLKEKVSVMQQKGWKRTSYGWKKSSK